MVKRPYQQQFQHWTNSILIMALSVEKINSAPCSVNSFGERELNLRNQGITSIGNTAITLNYFQSIDLSDNQLDILNNFSYLDRIKTLAANNNHIKYIYGLGNNLPGLENLLLMNNRIEDFSEIFSLSNCGNLKTLILLGNSVTSRPNYRLFTIYHIKSLTALDFKKVTKQERVQAQKMFGKANGK